MAGGLRYKFTSSLIQVLVNFSKDSPADAITAITKANPAVVTSAAHGLVDGDVVKISGVVGMVEANGGVFIVNSTGANTYELADTDSTGWTTYVSGGVADEATFSNFCELTGYNRAGGSSPEIDATSLCSTANEYEIGLPDQGSLTIDYNFAPRTAIQMALESFKRSGAIMAVRVTLPNSGGVMTQLGFVQQTSEAVGRGGLWTGSMNLRLTGPRFDVAV